jgi:hypothetical protein
MLINKVSETIDFAIKIEGGMDPNDIINKEEIV